MNEEAKPNFDEWCLVELMGHARIVGKVTEATMAGAAFFRVDVPALGGASPAFTRFFSPASVYSISPVTEGIARGMLAQARFRNEPVSQYDLPQLAEKVDNPQDGPLSEAADYCPGCRELVNNCTCD